MTILVLDIGSSSARALLFDEQARLIPGAAAARPYQMQTSPPGAAVFDAAALQAAVEACIDDILQHPQAAAVQAVSAASFVGNLLGVDAANRPLTPVFTYADTRSAEDAARLPTLLDPQTIHQRTGCRLHTAYQPARLLWLRRTQPQVFAQADCWLDFGTYLYRCWFGTAACSYSVASWSGMLNRADLTWSAPVLRALGLESDRLPALADYDAASQGLTTAYAARWPGLRDVPFFLPVGDGAAANIGCGCVDASAAALTVGTTAALRILNDEILPPVPDGLWSYRVDARCHLIGGATSEGGNIFQWARQTLRLPDDADMALLERAPDGHGLTLLPLLAGERSPGWRPDATGAVIGLRLSTTPLDILQAALEGVALRLALVAEQLDLPPELPVIGGGGALHQSRAWLYMIANALNRPVTLTQETEITARGAAVLALAALQRRSWADFPPLMGETALPHPTIAAALRAARQRQMALYDALPKIALEI